jgi:ribosome biogenesis GTPase
VDACRFGRSCSHTHEPDCAVREAVAAGAVPAARFESYAALLAGDA